MVLCNLELQERKDGSWDWEVTRFNGTTAQSVGNQTTMVWNPGATKLLSAGPSSLLTALRAGMEHLKEEEELFQLVIQTKDLVRKEYL